MNGIRTVREKAAFLLLSLVIVIFGIFYLGKVLGVKHSEIHYRYFRESDQSYDVLFFGSSHMINGISPNELYHDYGIRSYNLAMHGNYLESNYYLIQECLNILDKDKRSYPELIVIDVFNTGQRMGDLHNAWDSLPLNGIKVSMIRNLVEKENRMGFYFPFSIYHSRWNDIAITDYEVPYNNILGIEPGIGSYEYEEGYDLLPEDDSIEISEEVSEDIDKIKELCDQKGIRLLLISIPDRGEYTLRSANGIKDYAEEKDIDFVNLAYEDTGIDYDKDFFDDEGHLNIDGAQKLTRSMGNILKRYDIKDRRGDSDSQIWDDYYEYYLEDVEMRKENNP